MPGPGHADEPAPDRPGKLSVMARVADEEELVRFDVERSDPIQELPRLRTIGAPSVDRGEVGDAADTAELAHDGGAGAAAQQHGHPELTQSRERGGDVREEVASRCQGGFALLEGVGQGIALRMAGCDVLDLGSEVHAGRGRVPRERVVGAHPEFRGQQLDGPRRERVHRVGDGAVEVDGERPDPGEGATAALGP
ncbi:MAG TPA: hypothetical protein VNC60_01330, partial [Actinomycetota bacterium]|nr:hypothetical protein [Actinomycetota bacterium]